MGVRYSFGGRKFQSVSGAHKLTSLLNHLSFEPTPIIARLYIIVLFIEYRNNIYNVKPPLTFMNKNDANLESGIFLCPLFPRQLLFDFL